MSQSIDSNSFSYEVIIVDNDSKRTAERVAVHYQQCSNLQIAYDCEPEQSISLARNRTIWHAKGNLVAFIDDDEFPENDWLLRLHKMYREQDVAGVLGPVVPYFENSPPRWLIKGKLWDRKRFVSGTIIRNIRYTRTGNVLISKNLFEESDAPFDPAFGRTGGGDADFFKRMMEKGHLFVWCDEAMVYESVPLERQTRTYFVKRAFTRGMTSAKHEAFFSMGTLKSIAAIAAYVFVLLPSLLIGHHIFMKYLIRICDHFSKLLAHCKIVLVKKRPY